MFAFIQSIISRTIITLQLEDCTVKSLIVNIRHEIHWPRCHGVCVQVSHNVISFAVTMIVSVIHSHFNPLVAQN